LSDLIIIMAPLIEVDKFNKKTKVKKEFAICACGCVDN